METRWTSEEQALGDLDAKALLRRVVDRPDDEPVMLSGNDYLDLSRHPDVVVAARKALDEHGAGATASRLVCGSLALHSELERALAAKTGREAALIFGSGYMANCGAVTALVGRHDRVVADRLIHASILDAVRMSGAKLERFRHNEVGHLETLLARDPDRRTLVITESVFSMDGDRAPVGDIAGVVRRFEPARLMVDEAHSAGIFPSASGADVDVLLGTLSKAYGSYGGYVCGDGVLREWLVNKARSVIYTTALPPSVVAGARVAVELARSADGSRGVELLARAARFREHLQSAGLDTGNSVSQIVPIMIGENKPCLAIAARLRGRGVHVVAIRPPTVPVGTARLRCSVSLAHSEAMLDEVAGMIVEEVRRG